MRAGLLAVLFLALCAPAMAHRAADAPRGWTIDVVGPEAHPTATLLCRVDSGRAANCASASSPPPASLADAIRIAERDPIPQGAGHFAEGNAVAVVVRFLAFADQNLVVIAADPEAGPPAPPVIVGPRWLERPTGADYERHWPRAALGQEIEGSASLDCLVSADGRLNCTVVSEDPPNMGFGEAAVQVSRRFRMAPETANGQPTAGGRYRLRIPFRFAS